VIKLNGRKCGGDENAFVEIFLKLLNNMKYCVG